MTSAPIGDRYGQSRNAVMRACTTLPLLCLLLGLGCAPTSRLPVRSPVASPVTELNPEATAGVTHPALRKLLHDHWEHTMRRWPTWATALGDYRYDALLGETGPEAAAEDRAQVRRWLERLEVVQSQALDPADRLTTDIFEEELQSKVALEVCIFERWSVSPWYNALDQINRIPEHRSIDSPVDGNNLIARYLAVPALMDGILANLEIGVSDGLFGNAESLRRIVDMLDADLARSDEDWSLLGPVRAEHPKWEAQELTDFRERLQAAAHEQVRPALRRYRDFVADELLPHGRSADNAGMSGLANGKACYAASVRNHTTLSLSAEEHHRRGLEALEKVHGEFRALGMKVWGTDDLAVIFERLRSDPELFFDSEEAIIAAATTALDGARNAMSGYFGRVPKADCVVKPIPDYQAPYSTIAYYRHPAPDGSRSGEYFVNTYAPETRPRHEAEVLAFHESIPGHHLQIAIAQELSQLPAFRRHMGMTAFVEGWALYTERLADEMGLYSSDLDRLGMLSFDAWRAARLVVDTGLHAMGWTRSQTRDFLEANTPAALNNIDNEVDRYLNWPGQALAYKTGQFEILALRAEAEEVLGEAFDLAAFHDVVLEAGAVTLPILRKRVKAWQNEVALGSGSR